MQINTYQPMKILVIRVGRVGDMVMCTPALSALMRHYSHAEFTLLTSTEGKRVLGDFSPRMQDIWIYKKEYLPGFFSSLRKQILHEQFDHIYCFESNKKFHSLLRGASEKIYYLPPGVGDKHFCLKLLDVVFQGNGEKNGHYPLWLPVDEEAVQQNKKFLEKQGITTETMLIALHPTFSGMGKRSKMKKYGKHKLWPQTHFAKLSDKIYDFAAHKEIDVRVVMNLLPHEEEYGKEISAKSAKGIEILAPEPNFNKYKAFLQRVDLLVTPDTGPMHLAASLGTPLVALFSGKDPENCGPFGNDEIFSVLRAEDTETPNMGIAALTVENVFEECKKLLE